MKRIQITGTLGEIQRISNTLCLAGYKFDMEDIEGSDFACIVVELNKTKKEDLYKMHLWIKNSKMLSDVRVKELLVEHLV